MQGEFQEQQSTIYGFIRNSYAQRKPPSEFFRLGSFTLPFSVDEAFARSKTNIPKFLFYYLCIAFIALVFVVLTRFVIVIPLSVCAGAFYLSVSSHTISGVEITPRYTLYGCIGILIFLALISSSIVSSYLVLIAFLSIALAVVLAHACLLDTSTLGRQNEENI
ncbi:uncharacterized protein VICG_01344 [Vittaforma corneae ATCC 50505]|uniref:PRA1 family protein n=1 Tax=Vittaforma corneae (strain ATCC 50505) TaxID=993615 RepID=L2GL87_VITCO|nr:uncharacterized protein VICG_01344 [Vittaforma corneae ATCC 50505]ELA41596.1 hypothetical protein VICG_01344 [Vittaforma corneae ATCC 50505]